jgi:hypothetical protein
MTIEKAEISEFLIARGGPFYELQKRLGLLREDALRTAARTSLFVALAWGVPLLLAIIDGHAFGTLDEEPYLLELGAWARSFIGIGLFMLIEPQVEEHLRALVAQLVRTPILAPSAFEEAARAVNAALKRRNAALAEGVCLVVAILITINFLSRLFEADTASWAVTVSPEGNQLTTAGWWCVVVSNPIFWFLLARWIWRHIVWAMLLRQLAAFELRLAVTHPDGHGGIRFIGQYPNAYAGFVFAVSWALAAAVAHELLKGELTVTAYGVVMGVWLLIVLLFFGYGLLAFRKPLDRLKEKALRVCSAQATRHHRAAERKLLGENMSAAEDAESVAAEEVPDPAKLYESAGKLSGLLVSRSGLLPVSAAALLPLVIAGATQLPVKEILTIMKRLLLL